MAWSGSFQTTKCKNLSLLISLSEQSQSIANNTTTIAWKISGYRTDGATGYITCGGFKLVINGTTVYSKSEDYRVDVYNGTVIASGTTTISHNSDGTKSFSASAEAGIYYHDVNCSGSGTFTLPTIPRKSTLSVGNGTLGTAQTLTVTRQSTSFTHSIKAVCGSSTLYIKADGSTSTSEVKHSDCSIPFTPPLDWAKQNTTGTSVSVTYTIVTYNGSTNVGSNSYSKTCTIPASVKPSCSITVTDAMGYAGTYGGYIKGLSKFKIVVTATQAYGSAIKTYSTTANGSTSSASSFTTGVLTSYGTLTISSTVTDARSRSGTASTTATVLNYSAPKISALSVHRCDVNGTVNEQGSYVKVTFSGSATSLNNKNSATYTIKYKKTTATSYTSVALSAYTGVYSVSNATYIFAADEDSSYDVAVTVKDDFKTTTNTTSASTAFTIMHFNANGTGMAIGKLSEEDGLFDIGLPVRFRAGCHVNVLWSGGLYMTAGHTATLSDLISNQPNGVVLVFSRYSSNAVQNYHFNSFFVSKYMVAQHPGCGHTFTMTTDGTFSLFAAKYLYIHDGTIVGNDQNNVSGTGSSGIIYNNAGFVLRYVIGV